MPNNKRIKMMMLAQPDGLANAAIARPADPV